MSMALVPNGVEDIAGNGQPRAEFCDNVPRHVQNQPFARVFTDDKNTNSLYLYTLFSTHMPSIMSLSLLSSKFLANLLHCVIEN